MNVLITGANGFIGQALRDRLPSGNKVIGVDITGQADGVLNIAWEQADLTDQGSVFVICEKYSPDVVIHCAGIAHQKIGMVDSATYMRVNSRATENLATAAAKSNPRTNNNQTVITHFSPRHFWVIYHHTFYPFPLKAVLGKINL